MQSSRWHLATAFPSLAEKLQYARIQEAHDGGGERVSSEGHFASLNGTLAGITKPVDIFSNSRAVLFEARRSEGSFGPSPECGGVEEVDGPLCNRQCGNQAILRRPRKRWYSVLPRTWSLTFRRGETVCRPNDLWRSAILSRRLRLLRFFYVRVHSFRTRVCRRHDVYTVTTMATLYTECPATVAQLRVTDLVNLKLVFSLSLSLSHPLLRNETRNTIRS